MGLAAHRSFASYTACVISVVPDKQRKLRVDDAWIAIDAGTVVNQDRVHAQMEGSVVMGISNALYGGITIKAGATEQSNFRERVLRTPATFMCVVRRAVVVGEQARHLVEIAATESSFVPPAEPVTAGTLPPTLREVPRSSGDPLRLTQRPLRQAQWC